MLRDGPVHDESLHRLPLASDQSSAGRRSSWGIGVALSSQSQPSSDEPWPFWRRSPHAGMSGGAAQEWLIGMVR
jgi:hypothetical protein